MQKGVCPRCWANAFHFVWKPKYAWPIFGYATIRQDCEAILRDIAKQWNFEVYELQVQRDHVHLFVEVPPTICVSKALQIFKALKVEVLTAFSKSILI